MKDIPVYGIDRFNRESQKEIQFQVEVFDKNRDFKVKYPHRHDDFYEILYITQGSGHYTIDGCRYAMHPEQVFFLSPGQIHYLEVSEDIQGYIFLFTSLFYHLNKSDSFKIFEFPFFYTIGQETPPLLLNDETKMVFMKELFVLALTESKESYADKYDAVRAILDLILISCKRWYPISTTEGKFSKGKILVKRFKKLVEEKSKDNLTIRDYAGYLSVSANHLSETVKNITGRTSKELINDRTLMEIKRMLLHTDLTISEIAFQLNFSDQSYFSKYFKRHFGISPLDFRKENGLRSV